MFRNAMLMVSWACSTFGVTAFVAAYFIPGWKIDLILFGLILLGMGYMFSLDLVLKQENEALTKRVEILEEEVSTLRKRVDHLDWMVLALSERLTPGPEAPGEEEASSKGKGA